MKATITETASGTFEVRVGEKLLSVKQTFADALKEQASLALPGAYIDESDGYDWSYFEDMSEVPVVVKPCAPGQSPTPVLDLDRLFPRRSATKE